MDDNKNKPMGWPILYTLATLAGVVMLAILKVCGIISMSWPVVIAGLVWVPTALLLITLWVATLLIWIGRTGKKIREYNRRRKISRTLDESMKGLTLNGVGPIYGIRRNKAKTTPNTRKGSARSWASPLAVCRNTQPWNSSPSPMLARSTVSSRNRMRAGSATATES